jgi:hypothetical protein
MPTNSPRYAAARRSDVGEMSCRATWRQRTDAQMASAVSITSPDVRWAVAARKLTFSAPALVPIRI